MVLFQPMPRNSFHVFTKFNCISKWVCNKSHPFANGRNGKTAGKFYIPFLQFFYRFIQIFDIETNVGVT